MIDEGTWTVSGRDTHDLGLTALTMGDWFDLLLWRVPYQGNRTALEIIHDVAADRGLPGNKSLPGPALEVLRLLGGLAELPLRESATLMRQIAHGRMLDRAAAAAYLGIRPNTVTKYLAAGIFVKADETHGRTMLWYPETLDRWRAGRPGQGWRRGRTAVGGTTLTGATP